MTSIKKPDGTFREISETDVLRIGGWALTDIVAQFPKHHLQEKPCCRIGTHRPELEGPGGRMGSLRGSVES